MATSSGDRSLFPARPSRVATERLTQVDDAKGAFPNFSDHFVVLSDLGGPLGRRVFRVLGHGPRTASGMAACGGSYTSMCRMLARTSLLAGAVCCSVPRAACELPAACQSWWSRHVAQSASPMPPNHTVACPNETRRPIVWPL